MIYTFRDGFPSKGLDEKAVGERLDWLKNRDNGRITADVVVSDARKKSSLYHDYFVWDDSVAATDYRLNQARDLIRAVHIVYGELDGQVGPQYVSVKISNEERAYIPVVTALSVQTTRQEILDAALSELKAFKKKYAHLQELSRVISVISELIAA